MLAASRNAAQTWMRLEGRDVSMLCEFLPKRAMSSMPATKKRKAGLLGMTLTFSKALTNDLLSSQPFAPVKATANFLTQAKSVARNTIQLRFTKRKVIGHASIQCRARPDLLHTRWIARAAPCMAPQITKVQAAPCHKPPSRKVRKRLQSVRPAPCLLPPSGI